MFGLPAWLELPLWIAISFGSAFLSANSAARKGMTTHWGAVGFFTGCALGPLGILASLTHQTNGRRGMIFIGGVIGSIVMARIVGIL